VAKEKALGVIAGYACFNARLVRDWQRKSGGQFTLARISTHRGFGPRYRDVRQLPPVRRRCAS